jgi:uncharacterized membrane protein YedE/YeeE
VNRAAPGSYADAGWSGIALGALLAFSFIVAGRGLGASGAFAAAAGDALGHIAPAATAADPALADRIPLGVPLLGDWIVLEIIGVFVGGALSAWLAGRWQRSAAPLSPTRIARAGIGGALMGVGARLAYGCTSGLALSGGALLSTGAWIFIPLAFGTAMLVTLVARSRREDPVS